MDRMKSTLFLFICLIVGINSEESTDPTESGNFSKDNVLTPRAKLSPDEFEALVGAKPSPTQGSSYNGTDVDEISVEIAKQGYRGRHLIVEMVNYLNRSIEHYKLFDNAGSAASAAPTFIPSNTKEIFTFLEPPLRFTKVAFSYQIPNTDVRLACMLKLGPLYNSFGMGFVEESTRMKYYFDSLLALPGSSEYFYDNPPGSPRVFIVANGFLQARATLKFQTINKGSLKIELVEIP